MLGLGVLLPALKRQYSVIHVTDGAPRSEARWPEYAALRRTEFQAALEAAGGADGLILSLDCPDQQSAFQIANIAERLTAIFNELRPSLVFTHAYEGGHPDHDSTAAAVHAAIRMTKAPCALAEFAGYHARDGHMECESFLDGAGDAWPGPLTHSEKEWKRAVLDRYKSQAEVIAQFPLNFEPLRKAPRYDFARPPHEGSLHYEWFNWGVRGDQWRALAREAFRQLGLPCEC